MQKLALSKSSYIVTNRPFYGGSYLSVELQVISRYQAKNTFNSAKREVLQ